MAACSLAREGRRRQSLSLGPRQRENSETLATQKQLPSAGLDSMRGARAQKYHMITMRLEPECIIIHKICNTIIMYL